MEAKNRHVSKKISETYEKRTMTPSSKDSFSENNKIKRKKQKLSDQSTDKSRGTLNLFELMIIAENLNHSDQTLEV